MLVQTAPALQAANRDRVEAFLTTTGFDVALDSIALSAGTAPQMLGLDPDAFGAQWQRLSAQVFDTAQMHDLAVEILEQTLGDAALDHAVTFYASDLGQRLVAVENASHLEDDDLKQAQGRQMVADMVAAGAPRLGKLKQMNQAIGGVDVSLKALQEIQFRTLMAADAADVIHLRIGPDELRAVLAENEEQMRMAMSQSSLAGAAYTYRDFSDAEIDAYTRALEQPLMQEVYELLNAVQFEIMANRFELLARRMAGLQAAEDI